MKAWRSGKKAPDWAAVSAPAFARRRLFPCRKVCDGYSSCRRAYGRLEGLRLIQPGLTLEHLRIYIKVPLPGQAGIED